MNYEQRYNIIRDSLLRKNVPEIDPHGQIGRLIMMLDCLAKHQGIEVRDRALIELEQEE